VLGHLMDVDMIAQDLINNKYAYITDARHDMSRISIPVTWIYGKYDRWILENEVKDLMSVKADGMREVIEIPTGHNLRSSDDAIKTFKLITKLIYRMQYKKDIKPIAPDRKNMVGLITYERERLDNTEKFKPNDYWKQYLIGKGSNVGYDFYKNIKEFREFLTLQSELIGLENGEVFADIGCGTGLFIENMLSTLGDQGKNINDTHLVLVDLVPEALDKTRLKCEKLFHSYKSLRPQKTEFIQMDIEPNRLIPVEKFIKNIDLDFNFLRNRIDGLINITIDNLLQKASARLYTIMRGAVLTNDDHSYLIENFNNKDYETLIEFNRASRFINKDLLVQDMVEGKYINQRSISHEDYMNIRTSDIAFKRLTFSNNGLELNINFSSNYFDKIAASLFISYLYNPDDIIYEFYRILKPGGRLLVSSMKPDSDISLIFTDYIDKVRKFDIVDTEIKDQKMNLTAARAMLNEAAALFELEEDGYFKFYSGNELVSMLKNAGFQNIRVASSMGNPEQTVIITGEKP
jgi:ubiquinone/menaquinone biosynthesis C-methylase UbiE